LFYPGNRMVKAAQTPRLGSGMHHRAAVPMQAPSSTAVLPPPFFHEATGSVRFWVLVQEASIGVAISRETLHYRFRPEATNEDPLETYKSFADLIATAVERRVAKGSIAPILLREFDLKV
jgi:hypothetical protein